MASPEYVKIPSTRRPDWSIAASIFESHDTSKPSPRPAIVMGHGIGHVRKGGLSIFARAFAGAGYHAVPFDYLHYGDSDGLPRDEIRVPNQLQDFHDVVAWVRSQPERFDRNRIVVWGSSFGGMHTTAILAEDHELTAGIAQCPSVDGLANLLMMPLGRQITVIWPAVRDFFSYYVFRGNPVYIDISGSGKPGTKPALLVGDDVVEGESRLMPEDGSQPPNRVTAISGPLTTFYRPNLRASKISKPYLVVLPTWDNQVSLSAAEEVVKKAPLGEGLRVEGGHWDLYGGGTSYEKNIAGQLAFLERVLK